MALKLSSNALRLSARYFSSRTLSRQSSIASQHPSAARSAISEPIDPSSKSPKISKATPLSILPLSSILRSLATMSISSSPLLLRPCLHIMHKLAHSTSPILSPDSNPLLSILLKRTFYAQFCAGETSSEVQATVSRLRSLGFSGVILAYAKEVVLDKTQASAPIQNKDTESESEARIKNEIIPWANGTLETVRMTRPGDFVALKFTGAGSQALYDLSQQASPSPALKKAIDSVCDLAAARGVKLLFDAEQAALQPGIDAWTLGYMRKYNKQVNGEGQAVIYGTYQAYLKSAPAVVSAHLAAARREGFTLGVKLVRGAYLGSDPRHLICDTKADTDAAYDGIAEALVRRSYNQILQPAEGEQEAFPDVALVLAGHNTTSVRKVQLLCSQQKQRGEKGIEVVYAQLQGMADEVSCELVLAGRDARAGSVSGPESEPGAGTGDVKPATQDVPKAYKYLVWGTTGECMKYLYRRAQENKDAVERTREGRDAMARELWRRIWGGA
ncbi:hypothetical protein QTJ16_004817 [Diplocarpon rosae]|uniref:Proline dehydrogenase n=1 Tax=Diplocarpon rosae TaxID=946125 RepID=A0AAD9SZG0_9HELO|nr:hypothetical protein QTJ16_004817 [Diplocarpon rosae]